MKTVAVRNISRTNSGLAARLGVAGASTVHEAQERTGLMDRALRPIYPGARVGGTAVTILAAPGDNWMVHVASSSPAGETFLLATTSPNTDGYFGDLLATSRRHAGKGLISDAGVRDVADQEMDRSGRGPSSMGTVKNTLAQSTYPLCARPARCSGDVIVVDDDGVTVVARQCRAGHGQGPARIDAEEAKRQRLAAGELGPTLRHAWPAGRCRLAYVETSTNWAISTDCRSR